MGIVNVTPDSFSDGGRLMDPDAAVAYGLRLESEGADLLDVGGESTRPGSDPVPEAEERRRVVPVVRALAERCAVPISVDTRHAAVAEAALSAGAHVVNDVTAMADPLMAATVQDHAAGLVLMHMRGEPKTMQQGPAYDDVVAEVASFLGERAAFAETAGVGRDAIVVDPGLGFGKRTGHGVEDNLTLLNRIDRIRALGYPVVVGASRKRFIASVVGGAVDDRLEGSLAVAAAAAYAGVEAVRVHDVRATRRLVDMLAAIRAS
jgi:dihydropteroate synthase